MEAQRNPRPVSTIARSRGAAAHESAIDRVAAPRLRAISSRIRGLRFTSPAAIRRSHSAAASSVILPTIPDTHRLNRIVAGIASLIEGFADLTASGAIPGTEGFGEVARAWCGGPWVKGTGGITGPCRFARGYNPRPGRGQRHSAPAGASDCSHGWSVARGEGEATRNPWIAVLLSSLCPGGATGSRRQRADFEIGKLIVRGEFRCPCRGKTIECPPYHGLHCIHPWLQPAAPVGAKGALFRRLEAIGMNREVAESAEGQAGCQDAVQPAAAARGVGQAFASAAGRGGVWQTAAYSTVTLLARLRGLSTSQPRSTAMW